MARASSARSRRHPDRPLGIGSHCSRSRRTSRYNVDNDPEPLWDELLAHLLRDLPDDDVSLLVVQLTTATALPIGRPASPPAAMSRTRGPPAVRAPPTTASTRV